MTRSCSYLETSVFQCIVVFAVLSVVSSWVNNEVYPVEKINSTQEASKAKNDKESNELRDLFMNYVEDRQICNIKGIKELIIDKDGDGVGWWARRCQWRSNRIPTTIVKKEEIVELTPKAQDGLNKLLKDAKCHPVRQMVEIVSDVSPDDKYFPCSVIVKRCAGCCNNDFLECTPTVVKDRKFTVLKLVPQHPVQRSARPSYSLPKNSSLLYNIRIPEHKKCECQCKVKPSDCNKNQEFNSSICQCVCPATLKKLCQGGKFWSEEKCSCVCRRRKQCTTGMLFNSETCSCELKNPVSSFSYDN